MNFFSTILLLVFFLFIGCDNTDNKNKTTELGGNASGTPSIAKGLEPVEIIDVDGYTTKFSRRASNNYKEGLLQKYDTEDKLVEEAFYKNDSLHGMRVIYFESGDTQIIENYSMGVFDGPFKAFYDNKQLELVGEYVDNQMRGEWTRYYNSGALMEIVTFSANLENGPFVEYYENGNKKAQGQYLDGDNEDGELLLYNEEGILIKKMNCEKGICQTIWKTDDEDPI